MMRINEREKTKNKTLDPKSHLVHVSPETNKSKFSGGEIKNMNKGFDDAQYKGMSGTYSVVQCLRLQEGSTAMASCMLYSCQSGLD